MCAIYVRKDDVKHTLADNIMKDSWTGQRLDCIPVSFSHDSSKSDAL